MQCVPRPDPDVVATAMPDGDIVLLHLRTSQYFSLNVTGALIWEMMASSVDQEAMSQALSDRFEVTPAAARDSVEELLKDLKVHQLVNTAGINDPHIEELNAHE